MNKEQMPYGKITRESITEAVEYVFREQKHYNADNYIKGYKEEKQYLESLIFEWRKRVKEDCEQMILKIDNFKNGSAWTDPMTQREIDEVIQVYNDPLKKFDLHFNIITKRQSEIE